jgi:hypothetical protein
MAQGPFLIDQVQIEPGSAGTRRVYRDAGTGELAFQDPVVTGGLTLQQLAGLRTITNVFIVGKSGAGAQYTTIQDALDDVPSNASATNPYIVLVMPGRYDETINIVRDGVRLIGWGQPEIRSALEATPDAVGADHTLIISAQLGTIPRSTIIENFIISNAHSTKAAVRIVGAAASMVGDGGIVLRNCSLRANSAVGNYTLWASSCNDIRVEGGVWQEGSNLGLLLLREVSTFLAVGVQGLGALDLRYDTAQVLPANGGGSFIFNQCPNIASQTALLTPVVVDCDGAGRVEFNGCSLNTATLTGDRTLTARATVFGALVLSETVAATLSGCVHGGTNVNATAVLDEPARTGTEAFGAELTRAVAFDIPFSDADYQVAVEVDSRPANDETAWVTGKATTGFTINFNTAQTLTATWRATRTDV